MITLQLIYPDNVDICSNQLPIPVHLKTKDKLVLFFHEREQYWLYVKQICEIVDSLEYSCFFKHRQDNPERIRVSKLLLGKLIDLALPINKN